MTNYNSIFESGRNLALAGSISLVLSMNFMPTLPEAETGNIYIKSRSNSTVNTSSSLTAVKLINDNEASINRPFIKEYDHRLLEVLPSSKVSFNVPDELEDYLG